MIIIINVWHFVVENTLEAWSILCSCGFNGFYGCKGPPDDPHVATMLQQ